MGSRTPDGATSGSTGPSGEFALIEELFAPLSAGDPDSFGLTDDAALVRPRAGKELVVTADMLVAGVHFFADDAPDLIARKLLRVNLSDLAAKGALPHGYLLTIAVPRTFSMAWLREFAAGLGTDQQEFGLNLLGGDTVATDGPLTVSVTAMGWVSAGHMPRRSGAQAGDGLYVTGTIGDSALGLAVRRDGAHAGMSSPDAEFLLQRYLLPRPRISIGRHLPGLAHAAIDISDGLAADLAHICKTSNVGARIELDRVPLSNAARAAVARGAAVITDLVTGGDDYELLVALPPEAEEQLLAHAKELNISMINIGQVTELTDITFIDRMGDPVGLPGAGYQHF